MINCTVNEFTDQKTLADSLARRICELLTRRIRKNGLASLAVSGGSTPVLLFRRLSDIDIPWDKIVITLVDERWIGPSEADSNENLVRTHLLQSRAAAATFVGMKNSVTAAEGAEAECEKQLQQVPRPFDVLLLGMGSDGHTASLFPGAERLGMATDMDSGKSCVAITPLTAPYERMTLTLPAILDSRHLFLHISGQEKKEVLKTAHGQGAMEKMPIRFILKQEITPVIVYWAP